jgi:hypothetical protein
MNVTAIPAVAAIAPSGGERAGEESERQDPRHEAGDHSPPESVLHTLPPREHFLTRRLFASALP